MHGHRVRVGSRQLVWGVVKAGSLLLHELLGGKAGSLLCIPPPGSSTAQQARPSAEGQSGYEAL